MWDGNTVGMPGVRAWRGAGPDLWVALRSVSRLKLAALTRFRGAKRGANVGRRQATSGDNQPQLLQLDRPLGHTQPRAATRRMRLKIESCIGGPA